MKARLAIRCAIWTLLALVLAIPAHAQLTAIRAGQAAGIVATPENPLDKIQTLKRVMFVMKNGAVFRNDRAAARRAAGN